MTSKTRVASRTSTSIASVLLATAFGAAPATAELAGPGGGEASPPPVAVADAKPCGCVSAGELQPSRPTAAPPEAPLRRRRIITKILDSSSCGGFGGGTCFALDNSVCYLEITCVDDDCIMDCA